MIDVKDSRDLSWYLLIGLVAIITVPVVLYVIAYPILLISKDFGLFTVDNWKFYEYLAFPPVIFLLVIFPYFHLQECLSKKKKIVWGGKLTKYGKNLIAGLSFAVLVIGIYSAIFFPPIITDLQEGPKEYRGVCTVSRYTGRKTRTTYINTVSKDNLLEVGTKLLVSRSEFEEVKGEEIGYKDFECKRDYRFTYLPGTKIVLEVE